MKITRRRGTICKCESLASGRVGWALVTVLLKKKPCEVAESGSTGRFSLFQQNIPTLSGKRLKHPRPAVCVFLLPLWGCLMLVILS